VSRADAYSPLPRKTRFLASVVFGMTLLLALPALAAAADFTWTSPVIVNQNVRFTAHPDGQPHYEWDLDEDGVYDDDTGRTAPRVFHTVRTYQIGMRILDVDLNVVDEVRKNVVVHAANNTPPTASFVFFPSAPVAGMPISLVSTSVDPDSALPASALRWDLNADGLFDDAIGPSATVTYPAAGLYQVSLQVTTNANHVASLPLVVGGAGAPVRAFRLMSPFPVVRIAGRTSRRGARIRRLTVDAPPGSLVKIRCAGRGCPFKSAKHTISMRAATGAAPVLPATRLTRIRRLEGHTLRARAILRVFVTRSDVIGKYTRFRIRKGKAPARQDSCLIPGTPKPVSCPSG
jgi:hypothetical protein